MTEWTRTVPHMVSLWFKIPISSRKDELIFIVAQHVLWYWVLCPKSKQKHIWILFRRGLSFFNSFKNQTTCYCTTPNIFSRLNRLAMFHQQHMAHIKHKLKLKSRLITDSCVYQARCRCLSQFPIKILNFQNEFLPIRSISVITSATYSAEQSGWNEFTHLSFQVPSCVPHDESSLEFTHKNKWSEQQWDKQRAMERNHLVNTNMGVLLPSYGWFRSIQCNHTPCIHSTEVLAVKCT